MCEFEAQVESDIAESINLANSNNCIRSDGDRYIVMRESQARRLVERAHRYELAVLPKPKSEIDQRIEDLRAAMPYIAAAVCGIIGLIIGQAM